MEDCIACEEEQYGAHLQFYNSSNSDVEVEALLGGLLPQVVNPADVELRQREQ